MKIEIHLRDGNAQGHKLGQGRLLMESCRVYREAGDGLRLNNMAVAAQAYFSAMTKVFVNGGDVSKMKESERPEMGTIKGIQGLLNKLHLA